MRSSADDVRIFEVPELNRPGFAGGLQRRRSWTGARLSVARYRSLPVIIHNAAQEKIHNLILRGEPTWKPPNCIVAGSSTTSSS